MGYVYLIAGDEWGVFKIGLSKNNPNIRLKNLNTGNATKLGIINLFETEHFKKIEKLLHMKYATKRLNGEWFKLNDDDVLSFKDNCEKLHNNLSFIKDSENPFF